MITRNAFFIGGIWRRPARNETLDVVSPATEQAIGRVPLGTSADLAAAVSAARLAFDDGPWPRMSLDERRAVLRTAGELLANRAGELDELIASENGVVRTSHPGHSARAFDYFCRANLPEAEVRCSPTGASAWILHEPIGVVAAIVPWNGPLWLALLKTLPALLTGCTVVLKPAPETPLDSYVLAEAFLEAGLPPGVLNIVTADRDVSEQLVSNRDVDLVSFTGSTTAGRRIGAICGEQIKRAHLELGGKSAVIVLDDVELATVVRSVLHGGMLMMNGQSCVAWTRILVSDRRHDDLVDAMCDELKSVRTGDPLEPDTQVGPLVSRRQRERVEGYISLAQQEGARIAAGGGRPRHLERGWYVEPTDLAATWRSRSGATRSPGWVGKTVRKDSSSSWKYGPYPCPTSRAVPNPHIAKRQPSCVTTNRPHLNPV
jgi:acyl-CoA reductase-like NAD-dependent aldehyde dehydrogenase